jgi:hypothetical protein
MYPSGAVFGGLTYKNKIIVNVTMLAYYSWIKFYSSKSLYSAGHKLDPLDIFGLSLSCGANAIKLFSSSLTLQTDGLKAFMSRLTFSALPFKCSTLREHSCLTSKY